MLACPGIVLICTSPADKGKPRSSGTLLPAAGHCKILLLKLVPQGKQSSCSQEVLSLRFLLGIIGIFNHLAAYVKLTPGNEHFPKEAKQLPMGEEPSL